MNAVQYIYYFVFYINVSRNSVYLNETQNDNHLIKIQIERDGTWKQRINKFRRGAKEK